MLRASQYVQKQWIPVNEDVLLKIQRGIADGVYELDLDFLVEDLKLDYGLFLTCLRELSVQLRDELGAVPDFEDSVKLIHFAGYDRLRSVLLQKDFSSSHHDLAEMTVEQAVRIKESLISVSAVEAICKERKLDVEKGFSVALLRQFGLTLIAWNYPTVYQRALAASKKQSIEAGVVEQLGFSPQSLALQVLYDWGLATSCNTDYFEDSSSFSDFDEEMRAVKDLVKFCEVGETLARACHPEVHPPKVRPWIEAKEVILDFLGDSALRLIQTRVLENARAYLDYYPAHFDEVKRINPDGCRRHLRKAGEVNGHTRHCADEVKVLMNQVYTDIQEGREKVAIAKLVKQVIPLAGFYGGAIFIVDPLSNRLVPRVHIRKPRLIEVSQLLLDSPQASDSPIAAAFHCSSPIVENVLDPNIGYVSYAAGVLGSRQRAGVLYLEMEDISFEASSTNSLATFKAIRQAFCDCLKLS